MSTPSFIGILYEEGIIKLIKQLFIINNMPLKISIFLLLF